jgi:transposase InsO family protein
MQSNVAFRFIGISNAADIHLFNEKLREWEAYYNYHRPHAALDGQTPYERLISKTGARALPTS